MHTERRSQTASKAARFTYTHSLYLLHVAVLALYLYIRLYAHASATIAIFFFFFFKCVNLAEIQLMGGKSMKNKTLLLAKGASDLDLGLHSVSFFFFFFKFWNWKHLGGRCITYLNATRHISVCLNIPIYSKTVSALLKWIMDGKSRHWVISYDTIMFCLCQHVSLWDCCNLAGASWAWLTDILHLRLALRLSYLWLVK